MSDAVLVLNSGSSSLKFALIEAGSGRVLHDGGGECLGSDQPQLRLDADERPLPPAASHGDVLERVLAHVGSERVMAVGHRVVHGGERFRSSALIDEEVLNGIRACSTLAPLHNPANLLGIAAAQARFGHVPHVAVFDTAFHATLPERAYRYALPAELYEQHGVRRYGFHGTSFAYVATEAAQRLDRPLEQLELIAAHLGNGCSACAIRAGRSVDTTMGMTPLEGLVMGSRSGDVDPGLHSYLAQRTGRSLQQITQLLNEQSGLLGLSGQSSDMRVLLALRENGDTRAALAVDVFCYRLAKAVLALSASLSRIDALIFTGGIGENAASVRAQTLASLRLLGAETDPACNELHGGESGGRISAAGSRLLTLVIPTNEELMIARETTLLVTRAAG